MFPQKTDQAHTALQSHAGPLNLRERRMLILCDGKRHVDELAALFGNDARTLVASLHERGFLRAHPDAMPPAVPAPPLLSAAAPLPQTVAVTSNPRRSLVAAKMYMLGMLELQRSEEALAHRMHLQTSREPGEIVAHLLASLRFLQERTNPSMAQRVRDRLGEALPEEYLPALAAASAVAA
jgi:hypothetical protein